MEINKVYLGDALKLYKTTAKDKIKSILQILDPPYFSTNINSVGDNQWRKEDEYISWLKEILMFASETTQENGSIYLFHNDDDIMVDILYHIKRNLNLHIQNSIVWNKFPTHDNFSRVIKTFGSNRRYGKTFTEKVWFITKQDSFFETPFSFILKKEIENGVSRKELSSLEKSKNGNETGWLFNKIKGSQIPTREQWKKICEFLKIDDQYDKLLNEFYDKRYRFNQPFAQFSGKSVGEQKEILKPYSEVWEYGKDDSFHPTKKPNKMIENIIAISSNEGELILDPFAGSGVSLYSAKKMRRNFIGFENNLGYYEKIQEKLQ